MSEIKPVEINKQDLYQVGFKIKMMRMQKSITQTDLAEAMEISKAHLSNIETGKTVVTLENLFKVQKILDCRMRDFFDEKQEEPKEQITLDDVVKVLRLMKGKDIEGF